MTSIFDLRFSKVKIIYYFLSFTTLSILFFPSCSSNNPTAIKSDSLQLTQHKTDSIEKALKDSIRIAKVQATAYYPLVKAGVESGVIPVEDVDEIMDPNRQYNLYFNRRTRKSFLFLCFIV